MNTVATPKVEVPAPRTTFQVPVENIEALQGRIDKLNRRVALLTKRGYKGVEPIAIAVGKPYAMPQVCPRCHGAAIPVLGATSGVRCEGCYGRSLPDRIFHEVTLVAPKAPKVDGWEFVAGLTHIDGVGTVLRVVPGAQVAEGELARFRTAEANCEHCNTKRHRNDTFIVRRVG